MTPWKPEYHRWRGGGYYVTNIRYPSGAVGCVHNNHHSGDKQWYVVASGQGPYPTRDKAAQAERHATLPLAELAGSADVWMSTVELPPETVLFHGSSGLGGFLVPTGPAWFARDFATAESWAGWKQSAVRDKRQLRFVIGVETIRPLTLVDTRLYENWKSFCSAMTGEDEPVIRDAANKCVQNNLGGWYGRDEVMVADTSCLKHLSITRL
jgi:hypothetical protein